MGLTVIQLNMRFFTFLLLLTGFCLPIIGQETMDTMINLPEVAVSQSRISKGGDPSINVVGIDTFIIKNSRTLGLGDVLAGSPEVFIASTENFSQDMRIAIRGFGMRSAFGIRGIKLIYDGLPESTPDGQGDVDNIDPSVLGSAQIYKGPANGIYSNASGGIIELESIWPESALSINANTSVGSFGLIKSGVVVGMKKQNSRHIWSFSGLKYDGYRAHSGYKNFNFLLKSLFLFKSSSLQLVANGFDSPFANDPGGITLEQWQNEPRSARMQNVDFRAGESVSQQKLGAIYKKQLNSDVAWQTTAFLMSRSFENKLPFINGAAVFYDRIFTGGNSFLTLGKNASWKVGIDVDYQRDARKRFDNLKTSTGPLRLDQNEVFKSAGVFASYSLRKNKLSVDVNMREEFIGIDLKDNFAEDGLQDGSQSFFPWSGGVSGTYEIRGGLHVLAVLSTGFETPTLTEISNNANGPGFADITPARTFNKEIGLTFSKGLFHSRLNYFHIGSSNELLPYELPATPGRIYYKNAGASVRQGLEYQLDVKNESAFMVTLAGNFSQMEFQNASGEDKKIPGIPSSLHQLRLTKTFLQKHTISANLKYQGLVYADDNNGVAIDPVYFSGINIGSEFSIGSVHFNPSAGWQYVLSDTYFSNIFINAAGGRYYEAGPKSNFFLQLKLSFSK